MPDRARTPAAEPLLRLLAWNLAAGAAIAVALSAAVLVFDIGHLRSLIVGSDDPVVPVLLLVFGFLVTFGSVAMGTAVMAIGSNREEGGGGRGGLRLIPLRVRVAAAASGPRARR
jgi:hypothetical protein